MLGCDYHCGYCIVGDTPVATPGGAVAIKALFDAAPDAMPIPDGDVRFPRDVRIISASGEVRRGLKAVRHSYNGDKAGVQPVELPSSRVTTAHRRLANPEPP